MMQKVTQHYQWYLKKEKWLTGILVLHGKEKVGEGQIRSWGLTYTHYYI